jgi:hypothetical protein
MASEETPLLTTPSDAAHDTIYDRFTPHQKRWIVFVVSLAGLLPSKPSVRTQSLQIRNTDKRCSSVFTQATFVPSIPQIAKDLDSTHAVVRCVLYESHVQHFALKS